MTDIPQWAAQKRRRLIDDERDADPGLPYYSALEKAFDRLIAKTMPEPADPLVEIFTTIARAIKPANEEEEAIAFRDELAKRGGKIVFEGAPVREVGHG